MKKLEEYRAMSDNIDDKKKLKDFIRQEVFESVQRHMTA